MRNEELTDFDLKVRSLLEDAEEPVPSRVWSSVSGRLDRAAGIGTASSVWKWAGAALAAAAAIAGAFLLVGNADREQTLLENNAVAQVEIQQEITATEEIMPEAPAATLGRVFASETAVYAAAVPATAEPAVSRETTPAETVTAENATAEPAVAGATSVETAENAGSAAPKQKETEVWAGDPFAGLEEEKSPRRPASLYAQGMLSGNDNGGVRTLQSRSGLKKAADAPGIQEKSVSTYAIPMTFGLGVRFSLTEKLSLGTGLEWSVLSSTFDGTYTKTLDDGSLSTTEPGLITHDLQYIGIPVNVYYDIFRGKSFGFYVWGGGNAEKCISNNYRISVSSENFSKAVSGLQFSAGAGFGVEFALSDRLGLYIDPSARYWFGGDQPKSIRTEKPLTIGFEAGLRFNLK